MFAHSNASSSSFTPQSIQSFIRARCGKEGNAVWVYDGALYDPLDGHVIANVEGLELVRSLGEERRDALQVSALQQQDWFSSTVLSRKLFVYHQEQRLLDSIRKRPNAPLRKIPTNQAVALYDTATTYISHNNNQLIVHSEFPNGNCIWGKVTSMQRSDNPKTKTRHRSFDFSVFARPQSKPVPDLADIDTTTDTQVVAAPKRSQLIQFGSSPTDKHKFGARETYSYTMNVDDNHWWKRLLPFNKQQVPQNSCRLRYTRYGEGPPWYGPGKYCMLELRGKRVTGVEEAPPLVASVAAERVPGFLAVHSPIVSESGANRAIDWFQRGNSQLLQDEDNEAHAPQQGIRRMVYHAKTRGLACLERLRAASTITPTTTTSAIIDD